MKPRIDAPTCSGIKGSYGASLVSGAEVIIDSWMDGGMGASGLACDDAVAGTVGNC